MNLFWRRMALSVGAWGLAASLSPSAAQNQAKLSGTVTAPDGSPVAGVTVRLESTDGNGATVGAETNKKGRYLIGMVRPGAYRLAVDTHRDFVALRVKGKGINPDAGRETLWEIDQDAFAGAPPEIKVGSRNQIELNLIVGPPSMTTAALKEAEAKAANDAFKRGHELVRAGDYAGALGVLVPLSEQFPNDAASWYLIGFSQERLGKWDDALLAVDRALSLAPSLGGAHLLRGRVFKSLDRADEAESELRKEIAAHADPQAVIDSWVILADILNAQGHGAEAIQALEQAAALDPKRREVFLKLAQLYAAAGERENAASALEHADKLGASDDVAYLNLAIGYMNDGQLDDAKRMATRLIEKGSSNPNLSLAHSVLARCDLGAGATAEGIRQLELALELDPNSRLAAENREMLTSLRRK